MWHGLHPNTPLFLAILAVTAAIISTPISFYYRKRFLKTYIITFSILFTLLSLLTFREISKMGELEALFAIVVNVAVIFPPSLSSSPPS